MKTKVKDQPKDEWKLLVEEVLEKACACNGD